MPRLSSNAKAIVDVFPLVEDCVRFVCRQRSCGRDESDDFASWVRVRMLERGSAILAGFDGRSQLRTYLMVVVHRLLLDYQREQWGTWRPSADARALGDKAVALERLTHRDGLTRDEAVEVLAAGVASERQKLQGLMDTLRPRPPRPSSVPEDALAGQASGSRADDGVWRDDLERQAHAVRRKVAELIAQLDDEDAAILRLRFAQGLTVARIATALGLAQKPLYRRVDQLLKQLRDALERDGSVAQRVMELIEQGAFETGGGTFADDPGTAKTSRVARGAE